MTQVNPCRAEARYGVVKAASKAPPATAPAAPPAKASGKASVKPPETEATAAPEAPGKAAAPKAKASPKGDVKAKAKAKATTEAPAPAPTPAVLKRPAGNGNLGNMFNKRVKLAEEAIELPDLDALIAAEEDAMDEEAEEGEGEEEEAAEDDTEEAAEEEEDWCEGEEGEEEEPKEKDETVDVDEPPKKKAAAPPPPPAAHEQASGQEQLVAAEKVNSVTHPSQWREMQRAVKAGKMPADLTTNYNTSKADLFKTFVECDGNWDSVKATVQRQSEASTTGKEKLKAMKPRDIRLMYPQDSAKAEQVISRRVKAGLYYPDDDFQNDPEECPPKQPNQQKAPAQT